MSFPQFCGILFVQQSGAAVVWLILETWQHRFCCALGILVMTAMLLLVL